MNARYLARNATDMTLNVLISVLVFFVRECCCHRTIGGVLLRDWSGVLSQHTEGDPKRCMQCDSARVISVSYPWSFRSLYVEVK